MMRFKRKVFQGETEDSFATNRFSMLIRVSLSISLFNFQNEINHKSEKKMGVFVAQLKE